VVVSSEQSLVGAWIALVIARMCLHVLITALRHIQRKRKFDHTRSLAAKKAANRVLTVLLSVDALEVTLQLIPVTRACTLRRTSSSRLACKVV
jgi:hypothetical protein